MKTFKTAHLFFLLIGIPFCLRAQVNQNSLAEQNINPHNERFEQTSNTYYQQLVQKNHFEGEKSLSDTIPADQGIIVEDGYIEKFDNYLIGRITTINDNERFSVTSNNSTTKIYPNGNLRLLLNLNYRFLSFNINIIPQFNTSNNDDFEKGKTTGVGFSTGLNFKHWFQQLEYTRTTGYYLENTGDFDPAWQEGDPYIQFPELHYRSVSGVTGYSFNEKFSTKALMTSTERQLKSVGSFIPTLAYRYYIVDNREELTATNSTQKSKNFEILANAGYYYTYVLNKEFYISGGGALGYGLLASKITTRSMNDRINSNQTNGVFKWDARGGIGYNGERFFSGFYVTAENRRYRQANTSVINENWRVFMQLHVGYRFNAPEKLRKTVESIPIIN